MSQIDDQDCYLATQVTRMRPEVGQFIEAVTKDHSRLVVEIYWRALSYDQKCLMRHSFKQRFETSLSYLEVE